MSAPVNNSAMKTTLNRRYRFAASHRLHSAEFSEEKNRRIYGKCDSPYGHGHNYVMEVAVSGPVDAETGMVVNLADLDAFVQGEIVEAFDSVYLNEDVAEFQQVVPTTENLCKELYRRMKKFEGAKLERVRVEETSLNSFECDAEGAA
jgi:6-pyruvoyltetrahydropterin/6-carboxytetrahydropterin synthase